MPADAGSRDRQAGDRYGRVVRRALGDVGIDPGAPVAPLLSDEARRAAMAEAVDGALAVVDPPGVGRQVSGAVLQRARRSGGSLLGRTVALLGWLTGNQRRSADPAGYLRDWRRRGTLGRAVNPVHAALVEAAGRVPAGSRAAIVRALGTEELEPAVAAALDVVARDAVAEMRPGLVPVAGDRHRPARGGRGLPLRRGLVRHALRRGGIPVTTVELPLLGPVPLPLVLLAGSVLVSAVLGHSSRLTLDGSDAGMALGLPSACESRSPMR